ncbi:MAG TPA: ectonucleotide pyrophosphatase/phosphodiesterase [Lacunisphaera sp.]|jgi:predicted AlkP superfamily pyrophosphatase or phosphodiesterase|nr:ectonucleotide pyrophosphatase/phosphodiesterase [Lacunisphaera sp.]
MISWCARLVLTAACVLAASGPAVAARRADDVVILVSIDGFRWDYLQQYPAETPTLRALAAEGVHATRMTSCFPTKTFPNHYSIATGLYPAHHGIIDNWFYDPGLGETFGMSKAASNTEARWWGGEPIWITAERQGVRAACYFWPGSEAGHDGRRPTFSRAFDKKISSEARVVGLLAWLALPAAERPRLCTLYFNVVDDAGHDFGPAAPETAAAVRETDGAVARLRDGLARLGLRDCTDLVIISDHGMSEQSPEQVIFLDDLVDLARVRVDSSGPVGGLRPLPGTGTAAELARQIKAKAPPHLHVWLRDETPARFHFRGNPRIPDVVLLADEHWNFEVKKNWAKRRENYHKANHGWDPATPNMGALFIAHGPAFRRGVEIPDVPNIDVYNLLCATLGLQPAPNDGDDALVRAALAR